MSSPQQIIHTMDEPSEQLHTSMDHLPDSLLIEILIRLPTSESAHLCKPVCKRWLSLLSDHHFIRRFIHHHRRRRRHRHSSSTLILQFKYFHYDVRTEDKGTTRFKVHAITDHPVLRSRDDTSYLDFLPCYEPGDSPRAHIAASYKDLLICNDMFSFRGTTYYLCNPLTKQWVALPPAPTRFPYSNGLLVGFIITDEDQVMNYSYKLVQIPELDSGNEFKVEIFSSETCEWSNSVVVSPETLEKRSSNKYNNAVIFERNLHWILHRKSILKLKLGLNPNEQCQCGVIDLPTLETWERRMDYYCLGVCQGHLRVCLLLRDRVIVWEMEEYDAGDQWCIEYEIYLDDMELVRNSYRFDRLYGSSVTEVLAFDTNHEEVLYLRYQNQIVVCNMQQATVEVIGVCLSDRRLIIRGLTTFSLVHPCWPSPIPPLIQYSSASAH